MRLFVSIAAVALCIVFPLGMHLNAKSKSHSIKPQWINNLPESTNNTYRFVSVESEGYNLSEARAGSKVVLVNTIEHDEHVVVSDVYTDSTRTLYNNNKYTYTSDEKYILKIETVTEDVLLHTEKVAEYWEDFESNGQKKKRLYSLFMVQRPNRTANFDDVKLTTKYGMRGFVRSMIVPGWGQIYKGSAVKGGFILGGAVAVAAGIIITENTRADYIKKMHEQPKFADVYNSKATDWETARNVCIGAAAALYIYNLVDAVAADGAERAIVKKRNNNFSFAPVVTSDGGGFSLVYKF